MQKQDLNEYLIYLSKNFLALDQNLKSLIIENPYEINETQHGSFCLSRWATECRLTHIIYTNTDNKKNILVEIKNNVVNIKNTIEFSSKHLWCLKAIENQINFWKNRCCNDFSSYNLFVTTTYNHRMDVRYWLDINARKIKICPHCQSILPKDFSYIKNRFEKIIDKIE